MAVLGTAVGMEANRPFIYPKYFPAPAYDFLKNPLTDEKVELGRRLFYDPALSRDSSISCASCHAPFNAFAHVDHDLSHGIEDRIGTRNAPALMNLAWHPVFMTDGAVNHLDVQALAPISHPDEMDFTLAGVVERLGRIPTYQTAFEIAWGDKGITGERVLKSLSQFQLTLVSANAKYDSVMRGEGEFTVQEAKGYLIFKENCNSCHREPLFSTFGFANNGLPLDPTLNDLGRMKISSRPEDSLKFKIPSLRNIEYSFPYMHDGRFAKLSHVLQHYTNGIQHGPTLSPELASPIRLSTDEKVDLTAFLLTLSDRHFVFDKKHGFPDRLK